MWHHLWIPVLIPTLIIKSNCDVNKTDPDVFVRYSGHAEAEYAVRELKHEVTEAKPEIILSTTLKVPTFRQTTPSTTELYEEATEGVMFIPNNQPVIRREDEENDGNSLKIKDIMLMKSVNDAMAKNFHVEKAVDAPNEDIVFISGKNHDYEKTTEPTARRRVAEPDEMEYTEELVPKPVLNCSELDCNNTIKSVCGAKVVNREWKYRLFLNDCYFRKVNCALKYDMNRYKEVSLDKCKIFGAHYVDRLYMYQNKAYSLYKPVPKDELSNARGTASSRRSMTMNYNGQFCSHPCPVSCPEDYDPQCAISGTGQRRVFLNHCKLDHNSCFYSVVWHKRPLSECVGGKKADMRQNRGFIGWMQRVGIVDNKGRLMLE